MRPFPFTLLSALALVVTAGCVTDDAPRAANPTDAALAGNEVDPQATRADPGPPDDAADGTDAQPVITPVAYEGTTSTGACVNPAWSGTCAGSPGKNAFRKLEAPGRPHSLVITPAWEAETPLTETLFFSLLVDRGDGYRLDPEDSEEVASGTTIEWALPDPDATYALWVGHWVGYWDWHHGNAGAELPQDFIVEGHVTSGPP